MKRKIYLIFMVVCVWLAACTRTGHDARLEGLYRLTSENPDSALKLLAGIDRNSLAPADRHYYDFVLLKGRDKAYITHKSDSLYLTVLKYAEQHKDEGWYPEALYYGGRVYSDIGDYPTALRYFHQALDMLPRDGSKHEQYLRGIAVSQTGRLLDQLRLHKEAIPYIQESLHYDSIYKDKVSLISDLQLLCAIYTRDSQYNKGKEYLKKSLAITPQTMQDSAISFMYIARIYQLQDKPDSAVLFIRNVPQRCYKESMNCANAYSATIYRDAGIYDSAVYYSKKVLSDTEGKYKENAYRVLLDPRVRNLISKDSIDYYFDSFYELLETHFDENQSNLAIAQHTYYNYDNHYKIRVAREKENITLWHGIIIMIIISLIIGILFLYFKSKNSDTKLKLLYALDKISSLNHLNNLNHEEVCKTHSNVGLGHPMEESKSEFIDKSRLFIENTDTIADLRNKLQTEILYLHKCSQLNNHHSDYQVTEVWDTLMQMLREEKAITDRDVELWRDIEKIVEESSPDFHKRLNLLANQKLTEDEYRTSLLIKLGVSPTQISRLLMRTKGTISSRRDRMCKKMFGERLGVEFIDAVVKSL